MMFIKGNYFLTDYPEGEFDGVVSDPPYKDSIKGKLNEQDFDADLYFKKTDKETKPTAFLITFCNFVNAVKFVNAANKTKWYFHTVQIWDKRPTANPISKSLPRKHTEFILYFKKETNKNPFAYKFLTGEVREEGYERGSMFSSGLQREEGRKGTDIKPALSRYDDVLTYDEIEGMGGVLPVSQFSGRKVGEGKTAPHAMTDFVEAANGDIVRQVIVTPSQKLHAANKPPEFSYYFSTLIGGTGKYVIDPFCGSGNLLTAFKNSVGMDLKDWRSGVQYKAEKALQTGTKLEASLRGAGYTKQAAAVSTKVNELLPMVEDGPRVAVIKELNDMIKEYKVLVKGTSVSAEDEVEVEGVPQEAKRNHGIGRYGYIGPAPRMQTRLMIAAKRGK